MRRIVVFLALLIGGCSESPTGHGGILWILTEKSQYASGEPINLTITNNFDENVYLPHCGHRISIVVERRHAFSWEDAQKVNGPPCPAIYESGTIVLRPGEVHYQTVTPHVTGEVRLGTTFGMGRTRIGHLAFSLPIQID